MAEKTENNKTELSTLLPALLAVIVVSSVIGGAIFYWQNQSLKKAKEEIKQELSRQPISTATPAPTTPAATTSETLSPAFTTSPTVTSTPTDPTEGWLTYTNDVYSYQFKYPSGVTIQEVDKSAFSLSPDEVADGVTFDDKFTKYTGKICISVSHELGYVQISAPENSGFAHVLCGRTGRAYGGPEGEEALTIDGKTYTAKGFEEQGPGETLNLHNETIVVTLDDGTRIEYGSRPDEIATFDDYLAIRDEIVTIVESFKKI